MPLPYAITSYPLCGACELETGHDGDSFVCEQCGLNYGDGDETRPTFLDPDAPTCGVPSTIAEAMARLGFAIGPCELPRGHTSDHWRTFTVVTSE